ncbi:hypothetical protein Caka_1023 [Coraliomargarita akajimensis DSM 45221]|uniref:Uncharacterized protein n=1 Tax=Coraliomargarita akajimensis (strain DSM 45221 / IAM 15411 / JCM 23193 / KCTC 12865 / 04OKA010-24) TaxID=583355 RepID=D5EHK4_CORAD|nr:hypothetical protein Caka_1023 [Coraliomargarita akajimensis DSM 45221]
MVAMRVVQASIDDIVDVIAVLYRLVPAVWAVDVAIGMCGMVAATARVACVDGEDMFLDSSVCVLVVQVPVVKIVDVVTVLDSRMAAAFSMLMVVVVTMRCAHECSVSLDYLPVNFGEQMLGGCLVLSTNCGDGAV